VSLKAEVAEGHSLVLGRDEIEDPGERNEGRFLNKSRGVGSKGHCCGRGKDQLVKLTTD